MSAALSFQGLEALGVPADSLASFPPEFQQGMAARAPAMRVLFAAGRTPNTQGMGLEQAGVQLDARGRIVVDRYFRTTAQGIYAAGDVVGPALASTAMQQARAAACHACGLVFGVAVDQVSSSAVYGLPEVAGVGATGEQVQASGIPFVVGRCDLATTPRGAIGLGHIVLHVGGTVEVFLSLALVRDAGSAPACYRIRIRGHLDPAWSSWFDGLAISQKADGTTTLTGHVVDQAELFGVLGRLRDLGAVLLAVEPVMDD